MIPTFIKWGKDPNNYSGINLLYTALKLTTTFLVNRINQTNKKESDPKDCA